MNPHTYHHRSSRYDSIEGDEPSGGPSSRGKRRGRGRRRRGGPPGLRHRGHPRGRGHGGPPDPAKRRRWLEAYQRDLEQELADVAETLRRLDERYTDERDAAGEKA